MIRKYYYFFILLILNYIPINAREKVPLKEKIFFGGNIGLQFGTITQIEISPIAGYRITPRWSAGLGVKYEYYKDNSYLPEIETNIYGGKTFTSYLLLKDLGEIIPGISNIGISGYLEYEALSLETEYFDVLNEFPDQDRFIYHSFLLGGGLRFPVGNRSSVSLYLLWNLNESSNSPYTNPIVRIGFEF